MKKVYLIIAAIAFVACNEAKKNELVVEKKSQPNVVIIFTDDQGYQDVGCFGAEGYTTPNLDNMAKEGIILTDFYAAQAVCTASRAGLLTGAYPNRIGVHGAFFPKDGQGLNTDETTIAELLKDQGYVTAMYGKWHLGDDAMFSPNKHGFDDYFGIPYSNDMWPHHPAQGTEFNFDPLPLMHNDSVLQILDDQSNLTKMITERSVDFIRENKENPFFLLVTHPQPHVPLYVSDRFKGKSEKGLYGDVIMELDWSVGEILKTLKEQGLDENTLVIFTSDNGPWLAYGEHSGSALPLREGKATALEGGQREPFIARWPNKIPKGKVIETPLMAIDLLPTIVHITGAKLPEKKIDGKNAWSVISGASNESPQEAYFFYYKVNELQGVRYGDWKLYFPHTYNTLNGKEGGKNGLPVAYEKGKIEKIELYNLRSDISETNDVAQQNPEIVAKIVALADAMRIELGDKLQGTETGIGSRPIGRVPGTFSKPQE